MNERDSVKKLVMDSASQIALTEHLDTVRFCLQPPEYSYGDYISVTFYKEQQAVGNLFPVDLYLQRRTGSYELSKNHTNQYSRW